MSTSLKKAKITYPTGDPKFSVLQAFPAPLSAEETDPFLMCDFFGPAISKGLASHPDDFQVGWHPHRGMDILTYMKEGVGRHADSLGNRGEFLSPGMQWISVGSGIEHAEGGGTPAGQNMTGFQIWVNVPGKFKMEDPRYGTEPPENIPLITATGVKGLLLAGAVGNALGPFKTVQSVQIIDYELTLNSTHEHYLPTELDNCIIYVYKGDGTIFGTKVPTNHVLRFDTKDVLDRKLLFSAGSEGMSAIMFCGKRLNEPIAWHGPFVMNTDSEIQKTLDEYRRVTFLKKRANWDFKRISSKPKDISDKNTECAAI
jgi:redox-sensitive bicupin YhaK (pirin superfamily)